MIRTLVPSLCILGALAAVPALAADERISVVAPGLEAEAQLTEMLCVSETCLPSSRVLTAGKLDSRKVAGERLDAVVSATRTKEGLEVTVTGRDGQRRFSTVAPTSGAGGRMSVAALVTVSAKVIDALENPKAQPVATKQLAAKQAKSRFSAREKAQKAARKVASRSVGSARRS